jgi:YD repeat-containing protein
VTCKAPCGALAAAQGQHVTYGYNSGGQLTTLTRAAGSTDVLTTSFGYNGTQLMSVTTPISGHTWQIGYDSSGRIVSLTSPLSGTLGQTGYTPPYTTTFSYSPGQTQVVEGAGTSGALTTTYTLDSQGEATAIADGLGDTTQMTYDQDHDVLTSQDANGNVTTNYYQYVGPTGSVGLITETLTPPVGAFYPLERAQPASHHLPLQRQQ